MIPRPVVTVDLTRVRANCRRLASSITAPLFAVVKADAYGLGCARVVETIADSVAGFCVFNLEEAEAGRIAQISSKPILTLGPPDTLDPDDYLRVGARAAVSNTMQAAALRRAGAVLCVDTGMQRFTCDAADVKAVLQAGDCREAFTHATRIDQVNRFNEILGQRTLIRHAASSSLLHDQSAWLDAVRPGIALYRTAVTVTARIIEVHETKPPAGYSGFSAPRHGVIFCGYARGLRPGPCQINGAHRRVIEVGMQSAYVEIGPGDCVGDAVTLLGDGVNEDEIAAVWKTSPHSVLVRLTRCGTREYLTA